MFRKSGLLAAVESRYEGVMVEVMGCIKMLCRTVNQDRRHALQSAGVVTRFLARTLALSREQWTPWRHGLGLGLRSAKRSARSLNRNSTGRSDALIGNGTRADSGAQL